MLARFVPSSRSALVGRGGGSGTLLSAATRDVVPKATGQAKVHVADDNSGFASPVQIYQGSACSIPSNSFHANALGTVRSFSGARNIPRGKAMKYMPRFKKANSKGAINILKEIERDGFIPDVFHYSAAISKCAKDGKLDEAEKIFRKMRQHKVAPNEFTMSSLIDACANIGDDRQAIKYLREMEEKYELWPDVQTFSAAISACEKAGNWEEAIELLREMQSRNVEPNTISYSATISACEKGGETDKALDLLIEMENKGVETDEVTFSAAISACEKSGAEYTETALGLFREMCNRKIWPGVITYSATISACEKGGAEYTDTALDLFEEMKEYGVEPSVITYSALISSCEKGGASYTRTAVGLFDELREKKIQPDTIIFSALVSACGKGGEEYIDIALKKFDEMKRLGISPNEIIYNAITKACYDNERFPEAIAMVLEATSAGLLPSLDANASEWDLHDMTEASACMLLANALISSVDSSSFRETVIITGRGKKSLALRGEGPVLRVKVPAFIRDVAKLDFAQEIKHGKINEGAFVITKMALKKWAMSDDFSCFRNLMTGKEKE